MLEWHTNVTKSTEIFKILEYNELPRDIENRKSTGLSFKDWMDISLRNDITKNSLKAFD